MLPAGIPGIPGVEAIAGTAGIADIAGIAGIEGIAGIAGAPCLSRFLGSRGGEEYAGVGTGNPARPSP